MLKQLRNLAAVFVISLLILASCTSKTPSQPIDKTPSGETQESLPTAKEELNVEEILPEQPDTKEEIPPEPVYINPLTGLEEQTDLTNVRPVAIMINNLYNALPQVGISEADIVYEMLEEGGITRLLCIYNNYKDIPEIGSIRSARDYYIDISDSHDAIFIHAGGSTYAYSALASRKTSSIDGLYMPSFYRSAERRKTMSKEHTLMISGKGIDECIAYKGYRTSSEKPCPLVFSKDYVKGSTSANHIEFSFSIGYTSKPYITAFFDYDTNSGEYLKGQFGSPHIDGDDLAQLSFKNLITLTCPMNIIKGDALGCIQVHLTGTGKGTYSVDGTQREIVWSKPSRTSPYTLYESDGTTPLVLAPGKSYIAVVPTGTKIKTNE